MKHEPVCTGTKVCTKCHRKFSVFCFVADKRSSDGLMSWCRECHNKSNRANAKRKAKPLKHTWKGRYGRQRFFDDQTPPLTKGIRAEIKRSTALEEPTVKPPVDRELSKQRMAASQKEAWKKITPEQKAARIAKAQETMRLKRNRPVEREPDEA